MKNAYKPLEKPRITLNEVRARLDAKGLLDEFEAERLSLVGIRGYYADTFGKKGKNDRVYYDDALILTTNSEKFYFTFNFNVDPSIVREGVASLVGDRAYDCVKHFHHGNLYYPCLQIVEDVLKRDGAKDFDVGRHGINFHWDNDERSKFSLGCQTLPRSQWNRFIKDCLSRMIVEKIGSVKYFLIENEAAAPEPKADTNDEE